MKSCFLELESFDEFIISGDIYSYLILNRKTQAKTELKKNVTNWTNLFRENYGL